MNEALRPEERPPVLACRQLGVTFDGRAGRVEVLRGIDLTVQAGQLVSLLGTSGSGKTTLLRVLGGLQPATSGDVRAEGRTVQGPPEGVVTVFQDYSNSLLPWRTVASNVALGIERRLPKDECEARVAEALAMVGLEHVASRRPRELSGGMQQRVQIARAIAMQAEVLLMDEPFGALDAMTKESLQDQLLQLQETTRTTVVFVTHDIDEAVYLSDRIVVLGGSPASIVLDLDDDLPRPRDQVTTKESARYLELRHRVYATLGHG